MIKAVIFDLDGVLVDSTPLQLEANRRFLEGFGKVYAIPTSGREGMRIIDIISDYKDIYELPGDLDELYAKRQKIYLEMVRTKLQLFSGVLELLGKLKQRQLLLALATSGSRDYVNTLFFKFSELKLAFSVIVTGDDVVRGKPYPDIYKKALENLGIKPAEAVVIEDSVNGIVAAKGAKLQVICVPNSNYPDADYSQADKKFHNLAEVFRAIP